MAKIYTLVVSLLLWATGTYAQTGGYYALNFNGTSDDVTIKDNAALNPTKEVSVEAWIKPESFATNIYENSIFCKHGWSSGNAGYVLRCGAKGQASFNLASTGGKWVEAQSSAGVLRTNEWNHIMGTFDGDTVAVYVNGVMVGYQLYTGAINPSKGLDPKIGELSYGSGRNFDGDIDEVRVWDVAIEQDTMRAWMCRKVGKSHPNYGHLVGYYKLDEGTGSSVKDYSPTSNGGSINGASWNTSGAPLGDTSVYSYSRVKSLTLTGDSNDVFTINNIGGKYESVHLYLMKGKSKITSVNGTSATLSEVNQWGVFFANPSSASYNVQYYYGGFKSINNKKECYLDLFGRNNLQKWVWNIQKTTIYKSADSITINSSKAGEFILGTHNVDRHLATNTGDSIFCLGDTLVLQAAGNSSFTYQWYKDGSPIKGATSQNYGTTTAGKFSCDISRGSGCSYKSYVMEIKGNPKPVVSLGSFSGVCIDVDSLYLKGGKPRGGIYSGKGVGRDTMFYPSKLTAGTYQIVYSYINKYNCYDADTQTIDVWRLPNLKTKSGLKICDNLDTVKLTTSTPRGGTYKGAGIHKNVFYLDTVSRKLGTYSYTYSYTDANGCSNSVSNSLKVVFSTPISFSPFDTLCENEGAVKIKVNPNQGTYSGDGVKGRNFYPSVAGAGNHKISFEFKNLDGCVTTATQTAVVKSVTKASFTATTTFCANGDTSTLHLAKPAGGTYIGTGINQNVFDPKSTGSGKQAVQYIYTNAYGCSDTASGTITVNDTTSLSITGDGPFCFNADDVTLSGVSPAGGNYTGSGVSGNTFSPTMAGSGVHNIMYVYTDGNGCTSSIDYNVQVFEKRAITFANDSEFCSNADSIELVNTKPKGGMHSGSGVRNGYLVPKIALGKWWLVYAQTDANNCTAKDSIEIDVLESPVVGLSKPMSVCDNASEITLEGGTPAGGKYYVDGTETTTVDPASMGAGAYVLSYEFTAGNGCKDSKKQTLQINASPEVPTITKNGNTLISSAKNGNQWYDGNGKIDGEDKQTYLPTATGKYYVVVTNDSMCSAQSEMVDFTSGINEVEQLGIFVYPNPTNGMLHIDVRSNNQIARITIKTLSGQTVWAGNGVQANASTIDLAELSTGVYFMHISTQSGEQAVQKLIVNKY